jgi:hypothetical protein
MTYVGMEWQCVPKAFSVCLRGNIGLAYSITSSARASHAGGTSRPSARTRGRRGFTRHPIACDSGQPATVLQLAASCSAPRSDSAKIV